MLNSLNTLFTLIPDTTAGDSLIATFTIPGDESNSQQTWSLLDSDLNGVIDHMTKKSDQHSTKDYVVTWSDTTHFTASGIIDLGFGTTFDGQGRPTIIPFYTHGTGDDVLHEIPIIWQTKDAENVVATANLPNALSVKLIDTNGDNLPDQGIFSALSFESSIDGGPLYTTVINFTGWSSMNSTNPHVSAEIQTSTDPALMFTGTVTGTSSNPTTIIMTSTSNTGGTSNNTFHSATGNDTFTGGTGVDTVIFNGKNAHYTITPSGSGFSIHDNVGTDGTDTVFNVEKLQFTDHTLTIVATPSTTLSESYRIYKAAFDRAPDYAGLGFWYKSMAGGTSLNDVALGFSHSQEFTDMYGVNPTDANFLTLLYQNVLGRTYDQAGYNWWLNTLTIHANTQAKVLAQFSDSAENIANVAGVVANGIIYEVYAG